MYKIQTLIFGQKMRLWYSVFEFMSNRLAEKRTNFFGIPSSSKPIILQRSRLSIRIVLCSPIFYSSFLFLLFCYSVQSYHSKSKIYFLCCLLRKLERDHQANFLVFPFYFFVCWLKCMPSSHPLILFLILKGIWEIRFTQRFPL